MFLKYRWTSFPRDHPPQWYADYRVRLASLLFEKVKGVGGRGLYLRGELVWWYYGLGGGRLIGEERLLEDARLFEEMGYVLFEKNGLRSFSERPHWWFPLSKVIKYKPAQKSSVWLPCLSEEYRRRLLFSRPGKMNGKLPFQARSVLLSPARDTPEVVNLFEGLYQIVQLFTPHPHVSGYFWVRNFFFPNSKISTSTRIRIQIEFACPHVSDTFSD